MLHARLEMIQILDVFQVRAVITEILPGAEPAIWSSKPLTVPLDELAGNEDALSTAIAAFRLWSESTIRE